MIAGEFVGGGSQTYHHENSESCTSLKGQFKLYNKLVKSPAKAIQAGLLELRETVLGLDYYLTPKAKAMVKA